MQPDAFEFWIDHNLPASLVYIIRQKSQFQAVSFLDLNLQQTADSVIYNLACTKNNVVVVTKDKDFVTLLQSRGAPPKVLWITVGNAKNAILKQIFQNSLTAALEKLENHDLVEISNSI